MLLTPFRAGAAHVVQLGVIGIENSRRPFRDRRAETVPHFAREGADERQNLMIVAGCEHTVNTLVQVS
jgi:hypothetical protein